MTHFVIVKIFLSKTQQKSSNRWSADCFWCYIARKMIGRPNKLYIEAPKVE